MRDSGEFAVLASAELDFLYRLGTVTAGTEHLFAGQIEFYRTPCLLRRNGTQHRMRPNESFAAEAAADKRRYDVNVFLWNSKCLGNCVASTDHPLGGLVQGEFVTIPGSHRRRWLHRIVMFDWSAVRGLMLYCRAGVCAIGIAASGRKLLAKELIR